MTRSVLNSLAAVPLLMALTACATTGSTYKSGVGDTMLRQAPFIAGKPLPANNALLVLPVGFQAGATQPILFDLEQHTGTPMADLLEEMNNALASHQVGTPGVIGTADGTPPDVMFGCPRDLPTFDCHPRPESRGLFSGDPIRHRLSVGRPSVSWIRSLQQRLDSAHATHALILTLEVGEYYPRQRGLRGDKYVALGREYEQNLPWLTSLDAPVPVLQLTGVVVDRDGQAVRIAAEGLMAKRTRFLLSAIKAQELWQDKDVEALRSAVRADLPNSPLVWRTALGNVLKDLQVNGVTTATR